MIEGPHLVEAAIEANIEINEIILTDQNTLPVDLPEEIPLYHVTEHIMEAISRTETPQGIAAVCTIAEQPTEELARGQYLVLDGIQDPGNLGTMIRSADAAGLDGVLLGHGCVDPYNSKVIRATQGSMFHLQVMHVELEQAINTLKEQGVTVYGTALEGGTDYRYRQPRTDTSFALIIGNEANGVSSDVLAMSDDNLYVPIFGRAESLNAAVAASILIYALKG